MENKSIITIILLFSISSLFCVVSDNEMAQIDELFSKVNLTRNAVNFPKDWGNPAFKIPIMVEILEKPFEYPIFVNRLKEKILEKDYFNLFEFALTITFDGVIDNLVIKKINFSPNIKKPLDILKYAESVYEKANQDYQRAFDNLTYDELKFLELFVYDLAKGDISDDERYAYLYEGVKLPEVDDELEYIIELVKKINFSALINSAITFYSGLHTLQTLNLSNLKFNNIITYKSKFGKMVVGTTKVDTYTNDFVFIFDPDGNDIYTFDISTNLKKTFLAIMDFGGDDVYRNDNIGQLFTANYGLIFHYDKSGNDYYHGDDLAFSAHKGFLISIDDSGNDTYVTGSMALGAAIIGVALVINNSGSDRYSCTTQGQGFGGTLGLGLLANLSDGELDNDVYYAGGKYLHAPLAPYDYRSMSQGFGFGVRPDMAGGIGILFDEAGNDFYNGGVYSQGVAYYYALGILIDLEGNDFYNAVYYPQGSGIHLAAGFLYDESGDDMYYSKNGPGQGAGHDYGVGFLVDKSGNDSYSVDGGNGLGITNSVGIFIDSAGNDRYERKRKESYGHANTARESGSIGIFLDMTGNDSYPVDHTDNNTDWVSGIYGLGKDINKEIELVMEHIENKSVTNEVTEINPSITIKDLFSLASQWEVGSAVESVREARSIMLKRANEAIEYIFDKKLHTKSGLELRAILDLAKNSEAMKVKLADGLNHTHTRAISNTIYIIGELTLIEYLDTFEKMLSEGKFVNPILATLGSFSSERSIDILTRYLHSENIYRQVIVVRSLKEINTPRSINLIKSLKDSDCFLIKSMILLN